MSDLRSQQRDWLRRVVDESGQTLSSLAKQVGKHPSTLTTFMNNENVKHALSARTVQLIAEATGIPFDQAPHSWFKPYGLPAQLVAAVQADITPADASEIPDDDLRAAIEAKDPTDFSLWRLQADYLQAVGLWRGDFLLCRSSLTPLTGDVVVVEQQGAKAAAAGFEVRLYRAPFLVTAPIGDQGPRPELLDERRRIHGVVAMMIRGRRGQA